MTIQLLGPPTRTKEAQPSKPKPLPDGLKEVEHMIWNPHRFPVFNSDDWFLETPPVANDGRV